ncbi:apoptosis-antagonizing transcription factor [Bombardia bombarda]|uniref:Protein BFR2 n=1 Tax=Bombardia bombarda TaxID=252184 RepID=A0AA39X7U4_9PEZI|nr:apoptosis-antagonizing transcription factor [Bombardia bombarda]
MVLTATRKRSANRMQEWEEKAVKDHDPENEVRGEDDESASEDSEQERAGTEHYVAVGKSKLRQKDAINLGPEYRGTRVSRAALDESSGDDDDDEDFDEDEDDEEEGESGEEEEGSDFNDDDDESGSEEFADPDTADLAADQVDDDDAEIESDNALCESDDEKLKGLYLRGSTTSSKKSKKEPKERISKRPTAANFMDGSEEEEGSELKGALVSGDEDEEDDDEDDELDDSEDGAMVSGEDDDEEEGDDDDDEDEDDDDDANDSDDQRAELRKIMSEGQKSIVDTMSQAAKADADKGVAVRTQRRAFDSILHLRIRLQKALIAANSFNVIEHPGGAADNTEPYQAAEEAALKLWNTIDSVRHSFRADSTKAKRKRSDIGPDTPAQEIWESMELMEKAGVAHRRKVLDKWSARVRNSAATVKTRRLGAESAASQSLVAVLDDQLLSEDRLVKRARTPRSCAPAQAANKVEEDRDIYDDADFYQLLLKELVDQRSTDSAAPGEFVATVRWAALKEAKVRKQVDRKASKGRKLRYTVHEKLQNFMAPEDRRQWEEHAVDRFFGTLFGQKMELGEGDGEGEEDEEMGGASVEEEGLRLFRN